jgi:hypothetical protein
MVEIVFVKSALLSAQTCRCCPLLQRKAVVELLPHEAVEMVVVVVVAAAYVPLR